MFVALHAAEEEEAGQVTLWKAKKKVDRIMAQNNAVHDEQFGNCTFYLTLINRHCAPVHWLCMCPPLRQS